MKKLLALLSFCHVTSSVKHSLNIFLIATSGVPDLPEFMGSLLVDEVQVGYYDSNIGTAEPKKDWMRKFLKDNPEHLEFYVYECNREHRFFRATIDSLMKRLNQTKGAHILQRMNGCEWDDETGEIRGFYQYGYDGEDFIALDLQTLTWSNSTPQAFITKQRWNRDKARLEDYKIFYTYMCPDWLKKYMRSGSCLQRRDLPSVSFLQKTPSSLVTCHATGFYPNIADLFWRKDGEELHEDVDKGEILPNHDGTFQMSVDLNISSIDPEDWKKYDCVFQMSGVKDDVITKLDKSVIRTNWVSPSGFPAGAVIGVVVGLLLLLLCFIWRKKTPQILQTDIQILTDHNSQEQLEEESKLQ